jgi:hypothetical protein
MNNKLPKIKDLVGKPIQRDIAYQMRLFAKALSEDIKKDVIVEFGDYYDLYYKYGRGRSSATYRLTGKAINIPDTPNKNKVKAYCSSVNSYLQFPRDLRKPGTRCICDIVSTTNDKIGGFWRVIQGTVRKEGSDIVVA